MGRKGKDHKNVKSITVVINDKMFSIDLDSNERIKNEDDLKQISTNPPDQNKNKNKRRSKKKQIQQTNQNEQLQQIGQVEQIEQNQQLQINDDLDEMQFGDDMVTDDYPFLTDFNEFNTFNGPGDFQIDDGLNEDLYFDPDDFPNYDIFN